MLLVYRTIIMPVVLYGCETWSLTLREEHRLRVFENRVLWGMFGSKRDEVTGGWREILTEEPYHLYCSHNIFWGDKIEKIERSGACSTYGEGRGAYRILVGKPEGKRPF